MNIVNRSALISLFFVLGVLYMYPQNYLDDFKKFRQQALDGQRDFRQKAIADYADFMKQAWHEYNAMRPAKMPKEDWLPPIIVPKDAKPIENKPVKYDDVIAPPKPVAEDEKPQPLIPVVEQDVEGEEKLVAWVYCLEVDFRVNKRKLPHLANTSNQEISNMWTRLSEKEHNNLLYDCLANKKQHGFCDWVYLHMLDSVSQECYGKGNEATLLMAFLYQQSGYKMRLAKDGSGNLALLFASEAVLYNTSFVKIGQEEFYVYGNRGGMFAVCDAVFPGEKSLSLEMKDDMSAGMIVACGLTEVRERKADCYSDWYMACSVMSGMLNLYADYPACYVNGDVMTRWAMCANAPWNHHLSFAWLPSVKEDLKAYSEKEQVERLLNWVQTGFDYKTDEEVWGRERAFFAEETLYYPYCDCEDRSILFSKLVRDVVGLKVLLVYYPGHMATAVKFNEDVQGDYIMLGADRYVICDPTYINATVGMTMPDMDNHTAKVILLD